MENPSIILYIFSLPMTLKLKKPYKYSLQLTIIILLFFYLLDKYYLDLNYYETIYELEPCVPAGSKDDR